MFAFQAPPKTGQNKADELKLHVENSLKEHINSKIPYIIKIVG